MIQRHVLGLPNTTLVMPGGNATVTATYAPIAPPLAIVTGATPYAARPLARRLGIEHVIASELEVDASTKCFTGRHRKPLCYGHGKVSLSTVLGEKLGFALEDATFYTDSVTDLPLLERVKVPVAINPDPRLKRLARRRGWRMESW